MIAIEGFFQCKVCGTWFNYKEHEKCPQCHNTKESIKCQICGVVINDYDKFCRHCGTDRRWVTFECPHCKGEITAHRIPGISDDDRFFVTCSKCGQRFQRPDLLL